MRTEVTCPTCRGVLWEEVVGALTMYRCAARHAFTADTLLALQGEALETAVSQPIRALRERGMLLERLAKRARQRTRGDTATRFHEQAAQAFTQADTLERAMRLAQQRATGERERDEQA
jgi:two-component system chemotaxis response regulator CheB